MVIELKPAGSVRFAEPSDCVLREPGVQGAGLPDPQSLIVSANVAVEPAVSVIGLIVAE